MNTYPNHDLSNLAMILLGIDDKIERKIGLAKNLLISIYYPFFYQIIFIIISVHLRLLMTGALLNTFVLRNRCEISFSGKNLSMQCMMC